MHIWYIHHYGGGPRVGSYHRPYELARAWQRQGHSATVFIAGFHHLLERDTSPEPEFEVDGVRYVSVPARPYARNGVSRLLNMWDFSKNLYSAGRRYAKAVPQPDAVVASSPHPFTIFPAHKLARRYGAKLVFEIRDIWPLSITEILGTPHLHPFVQMCAIAERFALGRSDLIASVLPHADRYLMDRGFGHKPFLWAPNGIDLQREDQLSAPGDAARMALEKLSQWEREGCTTIVHAGRLGKPNAVDLLLEAVAIGAARKEAKNLKVMLIGSGEQRSELEMFKSARNLSGVHFSGHVSKAEVAMLLKHCHIGYAGVRSIDKLYRYGVSLNKFADYYGAALPVLLPISPCGDPVSESGGGIARRVSTPEELWASLRDFMRYTPEQSRAMGLRGQEYMAREYDYDRIARRYVEAIAAA